jgi:hypothetical protein
VTNFDELESANNFEDRGEVHVTALELTQDSAIELAAGQGSNVLLRRLLKQKGLPMTGSSFPAFHPDFKITRTARGDTQTYSWVRRTLATAEETAREEE